MTVVDLPADLHLDVGIDSTARFSIRQPTSDDDFIDDAWWPRSWDLVAELPDALNPLCSAGRDISRVSFNLDVWNPAPRRVTILGKPIRLGGYRTIDPLTVSFHDAWSRDRIDVLSSSRTPARR